jgi:hypothetical protein
MPKNNLSAYSGDMKMHKSSLEAPKSAYSQGFDNATLGYVKRDDKMKSHEASKLRKQEYKGRYQ